MAVKAASPKARQVSPKRQGQGVDYQEVARVAFELYKQRGCANGYDQEDWFNAEQIVSQKSRLKRSHAS